MTTTCGPLGMLLVGIGCGEIGQFRAQERATKALGRQLDRSLGLLAPTVISEGHPRSNGDGPLTIRRSIETKEAYPVCP